LAELELGDASDVIAELRPRRASSRNRLELRVPEDALNRAATRLKAIGITLVHNVPSAECPSRAHVDVDIGTDRSRGAAFDILKPGT
jgi:hypothetical protein